jgi:hypothetical protein
MNRLKSFHDLKFGSEEIIHFRRGQDMRGYRRRRRRFPRIVERKLEIERGNRGRKTEVGFKEFLLSERERRRGIPEMTRIVRFSTKGFILEKRRLKKEEEMLRRKEAIITGIDMIFILNEKDLIFGFEDFLVKKEGR